MNYDWYIKTDRIYSEQIRNTIDEHAEFLMNYFFTKLENEEDYSIEKLDEIFRTIIADMGCMRCRIYNESLIIEYNRSVNIIVENSKTQIYRNLKLQKILK